MIWSVLGDSAVVLSLGDEIDDATLSRGHAVADAILHAALPGVMDVVPAFATVTVYYDIATVGSYADFTARLRGLAEHAAAAKLPASRVVEIPVCYGGEFGPDLDDVARVAGGGLQDVIDAHCDAVYRVQAIGFVPGFGYLGGLPKRLHTPRKKTPRPSVPAGSVGIGGAQTGIYPVSTPGGWNLIGRTPLAMFDPGSRPPAILRAGDTVRFVAIAPEQFATWKSA